MRTCKNKYKNKYIVPVSNKRVHKDTSLLGINNTWLYYIKETKEAAHSVKAVGKQ
jgi:hypothetical protein